MSNKPVAGVSSFLVPSLIVAALTVLSPATSFAGGWANLTSAANPANVYLGDTPTMGTVWVDVNRGSDPRNGVNVYARQGNADLSGGAVAGTFLAGSGSQAITPQGPQATSTGTWYWGVRAEYQGGSPYHVYAKSTGWTQMSLSSWGGNAVLSYSVAALNAPSAQSATAASASSIDLSWTKGVSGVAKATLVVRSTSSNFTAPTQGSAYTSGNTIGSGTVVYRGGAQTTATDTGLASGTTYYYAFYAENFSYYSAAVTASATTPVVAPTTHATSASIGNERQTQVNVSWTSGNGSRRIVVAKAGSAPTGTPSDGSDYSATFNSTFTSAPALGDGVVVYDGTGSSFTLAGLTANTAYYIKIFEYNGTGAGTKYYTTGTPGNASGQTLGAPTGITAAIDSVNRATRIDLAWTKNNNKNVMVVRSTSSTFTAPTAGSAYASGATLGAGTVIYNSGGTSTEDSTLLPGVTYYYAFYSENLSYYSTAATATQATGQPRARNTSGGASPGSPAGTLYLGDTGTFTAEGWATIEVNWSKARMWLSADANLGGADAVTAYPGYQNTDGRTITSPTFFQTGTLYWGLQFEYGSYGENFWYKDSNAAFTDMSANGNGATLSVTVTALTAPSGQSATASGSSQINLAWTRGVSGSAKNTLVVRSTSSTFTAPTQGSAYTTGNALGAGTVISTGSATSQNDTGLASGTTYYYAFYAINNSYYSAAVTANATTDLVAPTTQATTLTVGSERQTQINVSWTRGNGSRVVVVAKAGSAIATGLPVDGADYSASASADFGVAGALGDGKVIYDGTGTSVTLTGLSADTAYYIRAYEYNGTGASTKYNTSTATGNPGSGQTLGAPTGISAAVDGANRATRIDLAWTKNNSKNVMVVRSTSSTFTAPTAGSAYATGATLGAGTVIYNSGGTSMEDGSLASPLTPGTTYYYAFYSENLSYYSIAATATQAAGMPRARNTSGGGSPGSPAGTLYLGDNASFTAEAWGLIEGNWSKARVWFSTDANIDVADTAGSYTAFQNTDSWSVTSPRFFQVGTLYWGMQVEYGQPVFGSNFWYKASNASWTDMSADGLGSSLSVTVTALTAPSGQSATASGASQINLAWTRGVSGSAKDTMVVRSTSSTFTAPTQGSAYSTGNAIGAGTVVYRGTATSYNDTGLSAGTTYYYAFYAENWSYYSASVTANATTDALSAPPAPVATAATSIGYTSFYANWNASAGATSYRLDVATDSAFANLVSGFSDLNVANVVTYQVTGLVSGQYFFRVRAVGPGGTSTDSNIITVNTSTAQGRNKNGGAAYYTPSTIYVGDNATFGVDAWATINGNWASARVVIDTDNNLITGGLRGSWSAVDNVEYTEAVSPRFTSAGTWYWGIQMDYNTPYGTNFWLTRDSGSWSDLYVKGTNASLAVTVTALSNPSSVNAAQAAYNQINLNWTKWNSKDVMVVRSTDSSFGTPTAGQVYSSGQTISGDTVIYKGSGTSVNDTGLTGNTTYYYRFYSENYGYYSAGTDDSDITPAPPTVTITEIPPSGGNGTLTWTATPGATYEVYRSDSALGAGMVWTLDQTIVADAATETATVSEDDSRFFKVILQGGSVTTNGAWGVIKPTVPAGLSLLSPPLDSDRDFNGNFGAELADALDAGSVAWIMAPGTSPTWTELTLNGSGQWVLTSGANVTTLAQGQGFYLQNVGSATSIRLTGEVGNLGTASRSIAVGYNILGLSEGKNLAASTAFESASPISSFNEETGDQIVLQDTDGSWRRLLRRNGVWYDTNTRATTTLTLTPGQAYYYIRRTSSTTVNF